VKNAPRELLPSQLESALLPVFEHAVSEIRDEKMQLKWPYFIREWAKWVDLGFARTWECTGAVVGALFTRDLFSENPRALVMFWLSTPEARRTGATIRVLDTFEKAAHAFGAKPAASFNRSVSPDRLMKVYRKRGYEMSEVIFSK
jgi:hypothetical protein